MGFHLRVRKRPVATVLIECIEGGIEGGLNKAQKWDILPSLPENRSELVRLITNYIMANVEEEFDLEE
jgi:hypothetical protein